MNNSYNTLKYLLLKTYLYINKIKIQNLIAYPLKPIFIYFQEQQDTLKLD
jgi:hypothetical protein